jgi:hypothetical protein
MEKLTNHLNSRNESLYQTWSGWLRMRQLPIGQTLANQLIKAGHLKSVIVAAPGSKRGVRLVEAESLQTYLAGLPANLPKLVKRGKGG